MNVRPPKWLASELEDYGRRVRSGELKRPEAIGKLSDDVLRKDEELVRTIITTWTGEQLTKNTERLARLARKEIERNSAKHVQAAFDDEFSSFFPLDTFPLSGPLEESETHAEDLLGRSERHHSKAEARVKYVKRLRAAVGPDRDGRKATNGQAIAALRAAGSASG